MRFPGLSNKDHEGITVVAQDNFIGGDDTYVSLVTQEEYDRMTKLFNDEDNELDNEQGYYADFFEKFFK